MPNSNNNSSSNNNLVVTLNSSSSILVTCSTLGSRRCPDTTNTITDREVLLLGSIPPDMVPTGLVVQEHPEDLLAILPALQDSLGTR